MRKNQRLQRAIALAYILNKIGDGKHTFDSIIPMLKELAGERKQIGGKLVDCCMDSSSNDFHWSLVLGSSAQNMLTRYFGTLKIRRVGMLWKDGFIVPNGMTEKGKEILKKYPIIK